MTALAAAPARAHGTVLESHALAGAGDAPERWSLDRLVSRSWRELCAGLPTSCPVCGGEMAASGPTGQCKGCGSELA